VAPAVTGIVGLGNMGAVLAANLVASGHAVVAHDVAGPGRSPEGAAFVPDVAIVARRADVVVLSLPDGPVAEQVARQIAATAERRVTHVVDTSTVGVAAAQAIDAVLAGAGAGIAYVDAPVSGGVAGARARTLMVMCAGSDAACAAVEPVLAALSDRRRRVGDRPGTAQALKLANNFLSATRWPRPARRWRPAGRSGSTWPPCSRSWARRAAGARRSPTSSPPTS
jgi:3-hydroxyisobutyrate dehydrogenase